MTEPLLPAVIDRDNWIERFDVARAELAQIETVEGAARFRAYAATLATAARSLKIGKDGLRAAEFLVLEAERRLGELVPTIISHGGDRRSESRSHGATLVDFGITKTESSRAQQVAAVPAGVFDAFRASTRTPTRKRLLRVAREADAEERRAEPTVPTTTDGAIEIRHGDLRTTLDDLVGTVDAIITDPPYPAEFLDEWDALGELAARLLTPSGLLVAMSGHQHLPEYMRRLGAHLAYRHVAALVLVGPAARLHHSVVRVGWKPLLIYDRDADRHPMHDLFHSVANDKQHHHWGQSESSMADIVSRMTQPGALVVDPFIGGGTTALVCRELGRRFVGCDIDADAVATSRERLS